MITISERHFSKDVKDRLARITFPTKRENCERDPYGIKVCLENGEIAFRCFVINVPIQSQKAICKVLSPGGLEN